MAVQNCPAGYAEWDAAQPPWRSVRMDGSGRLA